MAHAKEIQVAPAGFCAREKKRSESRFSDDLKLYFASKDAVVLESLGGKDSCLRHVMKIPLVNLIYDLLFDKAPTFEQVVSLCNLTGLIGALLLTMAVSVPTAFDYEEVVAHVDRVRNEEYEFSTNYDFDSAHYIADRLLCSVVTAIVLNTGVVFISLLVYLFASNSDFGDSPGGQFREDRMDILMSVWWYWVKWPILLVILALVGATIAFYMGLYYLVVMKFPDYHARKKGYSDYTLKAKNVYNFTYFMQKIVIVVGVLSALLPLSLGLLRKFRTQTKVFDKIDMEYYNKAERLLTFLEDLFSEERLLIEKLLQKNKRFEILTPLYVQYGRRLVSARIFTIEDLSLLTKEDLVGLNIPLGDALRIMENLK